MVPTRLDQPDGISGPPEQPDRDVEAPDFAEVGCMDVSGVDESELVGSDADLGSHTCDVVLPGHQHIETRPKPHPRNIGRLLVEQLVKQSGSADCPFDEAPAAERVRAPRTDQTVTE